MEKKFTFLLVLFALFLGTVSAQVVFDPLTYPVDSLEDDMTYDTIDGTVYLKVVVNGWSTSMPLYDEVVIAPGRNSFKCEVKYSVGESGVHPDTIQSFVQLMTSDWATKVPATGPASADFVEISKDGLADSMAVGRIQFAGQKKADGWPALVGDTLWVGKIVAFNPNAFLDPVLVPADSLPDGWTLDTIDGMVYFRVITNGWSGSWEFHKDIGSYVVPENVTAWKTMTKYAVGTSGVHPDTIQAFVQPITPDWSTKFPGTGLADSVFTKINASITGGIELGVLQVTGQQKSGGWPALVGDTVWIDVIEAEFMDSLVVTAEDDTIDVTRDTMDIMAQVYPTDFPDGSVTWSLSDTNIAALTEDETGLIAIGNGKVWVKAVANGAPDVADSIEITIMNQVLWIDTIKITSEGDATTIDTKGGTLQFHAEIIPKGVEDTTITWMVTPAGLATIDTTGLLTAKDDGTVTVTAVANDMGGVVSNAINVILSNQVPVDSIKVASATGITEITEMGGYLTMAAIVYPDSASVGTVAWSVSSTALASIVAGAANTATLTAVANGVVTVIATAEDGTGITGTIDITISGQGDNVKDITDQSIILYPNPVVNTLFIENAEAYTSFEILNMDGKLMTRVVNTGDRMTIDVSGLCNGMYILRAYQTDQIHTFKLIK